MTPVAARHWQTITDRQWQAIKTCLEDAKINTDSMLPVETPYAGTWPLRKALPFIVSWCRGTVASPPLTSKQLIQELDRTLEACEKLLDQFNMPESNDRRRFPLLYIAIKQAYPGVEEVAAQLKRERDNLAAMSGGRGKNNVTAHNLFWEKLAQVWLDNIGHTNWRNKHLERFLHACSRPFFPEETTNGAISAFVERYAPTSK